jgi:hypothetical protein
MGNWVKYLNIRSSLLGLRSRKAKKIRTLLQLQINFQSDVFM